ncbi:hypothetical protein KZY67_08825 [Prevotella melaninogenica]|uniref:C39 family peptidase n=1 Tax=Prevotella melaninogenica TaxID=28132 RepID=UPI001C5ECCF4|nr:C39 family peptidase [Prevotella melaninogenica]MBW4740844.1 hypothetical protein [Prevotella melaninogenica]MBW4912733.1 hypothetical protein [Prevotella melaninogenica]
MIKIIDDLDITSDGVAIFNRKWQIVHLKQGDMDGACTVYSLMMNLLVLKVLVRNQITNLGFKFKGNTAKGRLFKEFFVKEGLCRDGFYFSEIKDKLTHSFSKEVSSCHEQYNNTQTEQSEYLKHMKNSIDQNHPLMTVLTFTGGAHAVLAIGYEEKDDMITKVFCLDPGFTVEKSSYWNAVILLNSTPGKKYIHSYIAEGWHPDVYVSESLKITKR